MAKRCPFSCTGESPNPAAANAHINTGWWRSTRRVDGLRALVRRTVDLTWSPQLLALLLEELHAPEELNTLLGEPPYAARARYPHVLAVTIALRHSWSPCDFTRVVRKLAALSTRAKRHEKSPTARRSNTRSAAAMSTHRS